jgi:hypothetical protein
MNEESGLFRPCPDRPANSNPRCYRGGGRPADRFQGHQCSTLMTGDRVEIRIPPAPNPTSKKTSWTPPSPQGTRREGGRRVEHPLLCLCQGAGRHTWIRAFASSNARDKQGSSPPRLTGARGDMSKVGGSETAEVEWAQGEQEVEAQGEHSQQRP